MNCHFCGTELPRGSEIHRQTLCPECGKELRICLNCRFYTPGARWDCHETITEPVFDKERANFCDFFKAADSKKKREMSSPKDKNGKTQFNKLFGD